MVTATLDKTTENRLHDLVLSKFGLTPFLNTYPDFLAGAAVMVVSLFIAAGLDHSKTVRRCARPQCVTFEFGGPFEKRYETQNCIQPECTWNQRVP